MFNAQHTYLGTHPAVGWGRYMWLGGMIFSQCFSAANELFVLSADKSVAATVTAAGLIAWAVRMVACRFYCAVTEQVMNVLYFASVCGVSFVIIALHGI